MEKVTDEQLRLTEKLIEIMQSGKEVQEAEGLYTRSAHAKTVGLMTAEFRVEPNLPEECRVGVFAEPQTYKAFVRASHSSPSPQADKKKDARGVALKLLGVEGERFGEFNNEMSTQDFIMISWPAFYFPDLKRFVPVAKLFSEKKMFAVFWQLLKTGQFKTISYVNKSFKNQTSLLDIQYWSMTPYKLGDKYVKYTLIPTSERTSKKPDPLTDSYLSQNIQKHLEVEDATFDFCVQFYQNDKTTSLKDNMQIWKESDSPYIKVATLTLPKQSVGTQERFEFGENLSYSPAHCLDVHQPIGEINYARLRAYEAMSKFRHGVNVVPVFEPSMEDFQRLS